MFEINQKRQAFRLQIRSRQIKQKFASIRIRYLKEWREEAESGQTKNKQMQQLNELLNKIWENKNKQKWADILKHVRQFKYNLEQANENKQELYGCMTLGIDKIMAKNGQNVMKLLGKQVSQDECLGSTEQQQYYYDSDEDGDGRQYKQVYNGRNQTKQKQDKSMSDVDRKYIQLQTLNICIGMMQKLQVHLLSNQGCVWMTKLLWRMSAQARELCQQIKWLDDNQSDADEKMDRDNDIRQLEMQTIVSILKAINTLLEGQKQRGGSKIIREQMEMLGMQRKLSEIIQYAMQYDTLFKHHLSDNNCGIAIAQLHKCITSVIWEMMAGQEDSPAESEEDGAEEANSNIDQHYLAYGLYLFNTVSIATAGNTHEQQYERQQMCRGALFIINSSIVQNSQLISSIDDSNYLNIVQYLKTQSDAVLLFHQHLSHASHTSDRMIKQVEHYLSILKLLLHSLVVACAGNETVIYIVVSQCSLFDILHSLLSTLFSLSQLWSCQPVLQLRRHLRQAQEQIVNVMISVLNTNKKSVKTIMYIHKIWPLIFNYQSQHPMDCLSLYEIYLHYFRCFGRKVIIKHINIFLENVTKIDYNNRYISEMIKVRQTIVNISYMCQSYLNQQQFLQIQNKFQSYGLSQLIDKIHDQLSIM